MPPKRRPVLGRQTADGRRVNSQRSQETTEQRRQRQNKDAFRHAVSRQLETEEQSNQRRNNERQQLASRRLAETANETDVRRTLDRIRTTSNRLNETRKSNLRLIAFNYDSRLLLSTHDNIFIGQMDEICHYCDALKWKDEAPSMCCSNGKVKLFPLEDPPNPLLSLLNGTSLNSKHFLENIRRYV